MEAIRHQMEKLQSDLVQQSQTKNEAAGQVKKSLVQMNICIWWSFRCICLLYTSDAADE